MKNNKYILIAFLALMLSPKAASAMRPSFVKRLPRPGEGPVLASNPIPESPSSPIFQPPANSRLVPHDRNAESSPLNSNLWGDIPLVSGGTPCNGDESEFPEDSVTQQESKPVLYPIHSIISRLDAGSAQAFNDVEIHLMGGVDPNMVNDEGATPLDLIFGRWDNIEGEHKNKDGYDIAKLLIRCGAEQDNAQDYMGAEVELVKQKQKEYEPILHAHYMKYTPFPEELIAMTENYRGRYPYLYSTQEDNKEDID